MGTYRRLAKRAALTAEPPFTAQIIGTILRARLPIGMVMPQQPEREELSGILNFWHAHFYRAQEEQKFNVEAGKARSALKELMLVLPAILDDLSRRVEETNGKDQFLFWRYKSALALVKCLTPNGIGFIQEYDLPNHAKDWRLVIKAIPTDIQNALQSSNPNYKNAYGKISLLPQLLADFIPHITGEKVTAVAISTQFSKNFRPQKQP